MENQIFRVEAGSSKSMVLRVDEIWLSQDRVRTLEKFEKASKETGMFASAFKVPFSSISEVSFNELSKAVKIKYTNEKGKEKKLKIDFEDTPISNQFGEYLGAKLGFRKSSNQEGQLKPLLMNVLYLVGAIGGTISMANMDDTYQATSSGNNKTKGAYAIMRLIVESIGPTGVYILGSLAALFFAHRLYQRFKNPANEIRYEPYTK